GVRRCDGMRGWLLWRHVARALTLSSPTAPRRSNTRSRVGLARARKWSVSSWRSSRWLWKNIKASLCSVSHKASLMCLGRRAPRSSAVVAYVDVDINRVRRVGGVAARPIDQGQRHLPDPAALVTCNWTGGDGHIAAFGDRAEVGRKARAAVAVGRSGPQH